MCRRLFRFLSMAIAGLFIFMVGCRSPVALSEAPQGASAGQSLTLLESKLLETLAAEKELDTYVDQDDPDTVTVQRLFQGIDRRYTALLAENPDSLETRLLYGKFLSRFGDREGARIQFLQAAAIDPQIAVIHQELGNYYAEENDPTRAVAYYLNAIGIEPEVAEYHYGLGELLLAFREDLIGEEGFSRADLNYQMLEAFRMAAELAPDNKIFQFRYGEAFYDVEEPDRERALAHWTQLQTNPSLSEIELDAVRLHRARHLMELGRSSEARRIAAEVTSPGLFYSRDQLFEGP